LGGGVMTSLMNWVRCAGARRVTTGVVGATFLCTMVGCDDGDRSSNADDREPIAVTASGVAIMEVVRDQKRRTVEAVVVAGGEETLVTFEPLLDGPLPSGVTVGARSRDGEEAFEVSYGWDRRTGATWMRQQSGGDVFELLRVTTSGRVVEEYACNNQVLRLEYADVPSGVALDSDAEAELAVQTRKLASFNAGLPESMTTPTAEAELLTSLLADPVFANTVAGRDITSASTRGLCAWLGQCAALSCRIYPNGTVCGFCVAGTIACVILDWVCDIFGCDCCYD
jgi:hypothetical protein